MAKVPVVPMYFHAKNSRFFYQVAKLHPNLQTLMLPAEMMNDRENLSESESENLLL
jgi:putative hemolysin